MVRRGVEGQRAPLKMNKRALTPLIHGGYRWSSYKRNALGKDNKLLTFHEVYKQLGRTTVKRQENYRDLFKSQIDKEELSNIRAAWQTGTPLGNSYFKELIEKKLKCKVGQARRGRPKSPVEDE